MHAATGGLNMQWRYTNFKRGAGGHHWPSDPKETKNKETARKWQKPFGSDALD